MARLTSEIFSPKQDFQRLQHRRGASCHTSADRMCVAMKKVEAIIRHFKLDEVAQSLLTLNIPGLSVTEGRGSVNRLTTAEHGGESAEFHPKVKLELVVPAEQVRAIVETIQRAARTGQAGDGKVLVSDIEQVIRIRTGESLDSPLAATA